MTSGFKRGEPSGTPEERRALDKLTHIYARQAMMVESRLFGVPKIPEIARLLDLSEATNLRDWRAAKAWLAHLAA